MKQEEAAIDPKFRAFLMAVRAGLMTLVTAIEKFLDIEKKK